MIRRRAKTTLFGLFGVVLGLCASCFVDSQTTPGVDSTGATDSSSSSDSMSSTSRPSGSATAPQPTTSPPDTGPDSGVTSSTGEPDTTAGSSEETAAPNCEDTCPSGICIAGECGLRVFVSSAVYRGGDIGGLNGGDALCNGLARGAGLGGSFRAWLSAVDGTPADRFEGDGVYVLVDGSVIADGLANLITEGPADPISLDEFGDPGPASADFCGTTTSVLTGTLANGTLAPTQDCGGWVNLNGDAVLGDYAAVGDDWTDACSSTLTCSSDFPIYCFEQPQS